jgi:hypothetical protein
MRRTFLTLALLAALLVVPASAGATSLGIPLAGKLKQCVPARDATGGSAVFKGSMPLRAGATRMEMRFDLEQATTATGVFAGVAVPKWGTWIAADPGRPAFVYKNRITGLVGPVAYRATISFRWLDDAGNVLKTAKRVTAACRQPDLRANLQVGAVTVVPSTDDPTLATYSVVARNVGVGIAGPFSVSVGTGAAPTLVDVTGLARTSRTVVTTTGPACVPGTTFDVVVDPGNAVAESNEADNVRTVACPLPAGR